MKTLLTSLAILVSFSLLSFASAPVCDELQGDFAYANYNVYMNCVESPDPTVCSAWVAELGSVSGQMQYWETHSLALSSGTNPFMFGDCSGWGGE